MKEKMKLGLKSSLILCLVLVVFLVGNVIAGKLPWTADMTTTSVYSLSEQTKDIAKGVSEDVTIYVLDSEEAFPVNYKHTVENYAHLNKHISIKYRSPELYPGFAANFSDDLKTTKDSIFVASADKYVYLDADDYYSEMIDDDNFYNVQYLYQLEGLLTKGLMTVTGDESKIIYQMTGHEEMELTQDVQNKILRDNYELQELSLTGVAAVPEDASVVLINSPMSDYSKDEIKKLDAYVKKGGSLCYIAEAIVDLPNLFDWLATYGIEYQTGIVSEQDKTMMYVDSSGSTVPTYVVPKVEDTEVTSYFAEKHLPIFMPVSKGIFVSDGTSGSAYGFLSTSGYAFSKVNPDSGYLSREDDDIKGPFYLGAFATCKDGGQICTFGSSKMLSTEVDDMVYGYNSDLFLDSMNYMLGDTEKISVRGKAVSYDNVSFTTAEYHVTWIVTVILIPAVMLAAGILLYVRRIRRSGGGKKEKEA